MYLSLSLSLSLYIYIYIYIYCSLVSSQPSKLLISYRCTFKSPQDSDVKLAFQVPPAPLGDTFDIASLVFLGIFTLEIVFKAYVYKIDRYIDRAPDR